jgi:hypothetical protein
MRVARLASTPIAWRGESDIDVRVRDGEVTLDGTVTSRQARRRAEEMCDSSSGVREVVNRLEVTNPAAGPGARRVA